MVAVSKTVIIMRGLPGSGKSTVAQLFKVIACANPKTG